MASGSGQVWAVPHNATVTALSVENLSVSYGDMPAVCGVSFAFDRGDVFMLPGAVGGSTSRPGTHSPGCQ
jgi:ABC-type uncharacterized transport system ATPase subunit